MEYSLTGIIIREDVYKRQGIILINMKVEFGKTSDGKIVLADEISPDSSRLWDKETMEILDKDRFRRDLGRVAESYQEILDRINKLC